MFEKLKRRNFEKNNRTRQAACGYVGDIIKKRTRGFSPHSLYSRGGLILFL